MNDYRPTQVPASSKRTPGEIDARHERAIADYVNGITDVSPYGDVPESFNAVEHPPHYTAHPSGVECIQITEHMGFNLGNVIKYVWRADLKGDAVEDLRKAAWYLDREIQRRSTTR